MARTVLKIKTFNLSIAVISAFIYLVASIPILLFTDYQFQPFTTFLSIVVLIAGHEQYRNNIMLKKMGSQK